MCLLRPKNNTYTIPEQLEKSPEMGLLTLALGKNCGIYHVTGPIISMVAELVHYFQSYMAIYKGDELPEPKSMLEVFRKHLIHLIKS